MSVMRVGIMRMGMPERLVPVPVRMWFAGRITGPVLMPVMLIMHVSMLMFHRLVRVFVFVPL